jgi:hypothetical protein
MEEASQSSPRRLAQPITYEDMLRVVRRAAMHTVLDTVQCCANQGAATPPQVLLLWIPMFMGDTTFITTDFRTQDPLL